MKIKEIHFILENCDMITVDGKYIGDFCMEDIRTSIKRIACNAIEKMQTCYSFLIEIHKDANKERYQFGQISERFKQTTFARLTEFNDITQVEIILTDESGEEIKEHYFLHWTGESDCENNAQKSYISKPGHLYIVVAEGEDLKDFFDLEELDDEEEIDFKMDMYDVGDIYGDPNRYTE